MVADFFSTAVERENIQHKRNLGLPAPWTEDLVLANHRFCNVFREDDKTTQWFRANVRDRLRNKPTAVIRATVGFRMFNLIATGKRLRSMLRAGIWDSAHVRKHLGGASQVVTGAYMVRTPYGMNKIEGICEMMEVFLDSGVIQKLARGPSTMTLQEAHGLIEQVPFQGHFTAYEIVTDLSHTCVLENAPDIMSWANPGPGAQRGLQWVMQREFGRGKDDMERMLQCMRELLRLSWDEDNWPWQDKPWTMREVEHWLCEYDKYCRGQLGQRLKRKYP